jgi:hypothetical protein
LQSQAQLARGVKKFVIDDYQKNRSLNRSSAGTAVETSRLAGLSENCLQDQGVRVSGSTENEPFNRFFQETRGVLFNWNGAAEYVETLPASSQDLRGARIIAFRVAQQPKHPSTLGAITFAVELEDEDKRTNAVNVRILDKVPGIYAAQFSSYDPTTPTHFTSIDTTSAVFTTMRIPVAAFAANGANINLAKVKKIRIKLAGPGDAEKGRIAIDDVEVEQ